MNKHKIIEQCNEECVYCCEGCGNFFKNPKIRVKHDGIVTKITNCCPDCRSINIIKIHFST